MVLAPTRWKLRKAVRAIRELVAGLELELAPNKTFVGRISKGFDFLGYWFGPEGVRVAMRTVERFAERVNRLYEQGAEEGRIGEYVRRWWGWVRGGLDFWLGGWGGEVSQLESWKKLPPNFNNFQAVTPMATGPMASFLTSRPRGS